MDSIRTGKRENHTIIHCTNSARHTNLRLIFFISNSFVNSDISTDSAKIKREKILAYIEVRKFSLFRNFDARQVEKAR